ncbi:MAG TPA: hypothetical protein DCY18_08440 [Thauera sp.]|nr:hypothetical protein [Thauera sp.]HRJ23649.1 hypothetical protein [Thauera sp.]
MFPLFPFVAGVLTGAVALRLIKTDKTKAGLEKAQDKLRGATVSSLEAIESASARVRQRLTAEDAEASATAEAVADVVAPAAAPEAPPRKRAARAARPGAGRAPKTSSKAKAAPGGEPADDGEAGS